MNITHLVTVVISCPGHIEKDRAEQATVVRWLYDVILEGLDPGAPYPVTRDEAASVIRIDHSLVPIREQDL